MANDAQHLLAVLYDWHNERRLADQVEDIDHWLAAIPRGSNVAILGAGTGRIAAPLGKAGSRVVALDRDLERLRRASPLHLRRIGGDFDALPFRAAFDRIVFPYNAIQLNQPSSVLRILQEARRTVASGGSVWLDLSDRFGARRSHDWRLLLDDHCPQLGVRVQEWQKATKQFDHLELKLRFRVRGIGDLCATELWYFHPHSALSGTIAEAGLLVRQLLSSYASDTPGHRRVYELVRSSSAADRDVPLGSPCQPGKDGG